MVNYTTSITQGYRYLFWTIWSFRLRRLTIWYLNLRFCLLEVEPPKWRKWNNKYASGEIHWHRYSWCSLIVVAHCQWLTTGQWHSAVSTTNKDDLHDITELLSKVALNIIALTLRIAICVTIILVRVISKNVHSWVNILQKMKRTKYGHWRIIHSEQHLKIHYECDK